MIGSYGAEAGWSGYPDSRAEAMGDLWDSGGALGGEYAQRSSPQGVATVVNAPNKLRLRSQPSTDGETLAYMDNGGQVVFYEDLGNGWADVEWYGTRGYASMQYLQLGASRAGHADIPIPPYVEPVPPSPVINPPDPAPPAPAPDAPKSKTAWYVVGGLAAAAAAYYYL